MPDLDMTPDPSKDLRPRTLAIERHLGIGDLIWHIPYFQAIAAQSYGGKVSVIAPPTTCAQSLLAADPCIEYVFDFELRTRTGRRGEHHGWRAQWAFAKKLRQHGFQRAFIFSDKARFGTLCIMAGVGARYGFGFGEDRWVLNRKPYIKPYAEAGSPVYPDATAFALAHGLVSAPVVPKMQVPHDLVETARQQLAGLPRPLYAFAIGSSEPYKQWGASRFAALTNMLTEHGCSVLLLGGRAERDMVDDILRWVPPALQSRVRGQTEGSVLDSAALLRNVDFLIGNDTGILNMAAACDVPCLGLFGGSKLLKHDPIMHGIEAERIGAITPEDIVARLVALGAPGWAAPQVRALG